MDVYYVEMSSLAFTLLNVPVSVFALLMNIFFFYCMFCSEEAQLSLKPPLNALVMSRIGCSIIHNTFNLLFIVYDFIYPAAWLYVLSAASILFTMKTGFSSSVGLQVCYFFQIVPVRQPLLVWMRKNIKLFVYSVLIFDRLFFLTEFIIHVTLELQYYEALLSNSSNTNNPNGTLSLGYYIFVTDFWMRCCYLFFGLIVMLTASIATAVYLRKHIKRMEGNASSFTTFRKRQQMRVAIMGIVQSVLFFFASGWFMAEDLILFFVDNVYLDSHLVLSVMALYSFGATILLGVGQSKFRLEIKCFFKKLFS